MNKMPKLLFALLFLLSPIPATGQTSPLVNEWGKAVNLAWANKDYARILELMTQKRADIGRDPTIDQKLELAEVDRNIAAATGRAKLGNPCPVLKRANDNLLALFDSEMAPDGPQVYGTSIAHQTDDVMTLVAEFGCAKTMVGPADTSASGIYYLQGVMETGSGLKLMDDATYEWFLVIGGLDMFSKGVWQRDGDTIQLIADPAPPKLKFLELGKVKSFGSNSRPCAKNDQKMMNYALQLKLDDTGFGQRFGIEASLLYADGSGEQLGPANEDLRFNICLNKDNPANMVEIIMLENEALYVEKFNITPKAETLQIVEFKEPEITDSIWAYHMLRFENGNLFLPAMFPGNFYVKNDSNLAE